MISQAPPGPIPMLRALAHLHWSAGLYPAGHPAVSSAVETLRESLDALLEGRALVRIDIVDGDAHLDGQSFRRESQTAAGPMGELTALGIQSMHIRGGIDEPELHRIAELLGDVKAGGASLSAQELRRRDITHVSFGKLVPLDTRWRYYEWPEAPTGSVDPLYAESLAKAEDAFGDVGEGRAPDVRSIRDLLRLLMYGVARRGSALGQILAVKQYENHTYCHSINVATLSLLLGRQLALDDAALATLAEGALLHDVGKTRIPVEVLRKPGPLDARERRLMQRHPRLGAELLVEATGLAPLTPTLALEHHRHFDGGGYPDLGRNERPHVMSQVVAVVDTYEALTGARSYREPAFPEQACLVLARMAGEKLNPALVKAFVAAVTFFPVGSLVRTDRDEIGVVVATHPADPLHPVLRLAEARAGGGPTVDTSERDDAGAYVRHIAESLRPTDLQPALRERLEAEIAAVA